MPRNFKSTAVYVRPDPKFGSKLASKIINKIMWDGKKTVAQKIFYNALDLCKSKVPEDVDPVEIFTKAIDNVKPQVEVRSKRVGGATYQVPMEVRKSRQQSLAIRWVVEAARGGKGKEYHKRLASELLDAFNDNPQGEAIKKKINVHKMAEANKAYSHFAW